MLAVGQVRRGRRACSPARCGRCPASRAPARSSRGAARGPGVTCPVSGCSSPASSRSRVVLPAPFEPEHHDPGAPVHRHVHVGEDLQRAVGLGQTRAPSAASCRTERAREAQPAPTRPAGRSALTPASSRCARRSMPCAAWALVGLRPHLVRLRLQRGRLALGAGRSRLRRRASVSRCSRYVRPADVVDVELGAVGVEVEDPC